MINFEWQYIASPPVRGIVLEEHREIDPVRKLLAHDRVDNSSQVLLRAIDIELAVNTDYGASRLEPFDNSKNVLAHYMNRATSKIERDALLGMFTLAKSFSDDIKLPQIILEGSAYNHFYTVLGNTSLRSIGRREAKKIHELTGSTVVPTDTETLEDIEDRLNQNVLSIDCPANIDIYNRQSHVVTANPKQWLLRFYNARARNFIETWEPLA